MEIMKTIQGKECYWFGFIGLNDFARWGIKNTSHLNAILLHNGAKFNQVISICYFDTLQQAKDCEKILNEQSYDKSILQNNFFAITNKYCGQTIPQICYLWNSIEEHDECLISEENIVTMFEDIINPKELKNFLQNNDISVVIEKLNSLMVMKKLLTN